MYNNECFYFFWYFFFKPIKISLTKWTYQSTPFGLNMKWVRENPIKKNKPKIFKFQTAKETFFWKKKLYLNGKFNMLWHFRSMYLKKYYNVNKIYWNEGTEL